MFVSDFQTISHLAHSPRPTFAVGSRVIKAAQLFSLLLMLLVFAGCQGEKRVAVVPVKGKINSYKGEVPVGANVVLRKTNGEEEGVTPSAKVQPDGSFQFTTYDVGDGAPPGDYVLTIEWFKIVGDGRGPNVLPKKYAKPESSPVIVNVSSATELPAIELEN